MHRIHGREIGYTEGVSSIIWFGNIFEFEEELDCATYLFLFGFSISADGFFDLERRIFEYWYSMFTNRDNDDSATLRYVDTSLEIR